MKAMQVTQGAQITVGPGTAATQTSAITDMINAMMPLMMLMMVMGMLMPMMRGMTGAFAPAR